MEGFHGSRKSLRLADAIFKARGKKWDPKVDRPIEIDAPEPVDENINVGNDNNADVANDISAGPQTVAEIVNEINARGQEPVAENVNVASKINAGSGDDFVNPPPPKRQKQSICKRKRKKRTESGVLVEKNKEENASKSKKQKENQKGKRKKKNTSFEGIMSRQSPSKMVTLFLTMDEKFKKVVKSMGFSSMVSCKVDAIPTKLAYWVVDHFDASTCEMQLGKEKMKIKKEDVGLILGFPMGNISVNSVERAGVGDNNVISEWRKQYPILTKGTQRIYITNVIDMISKDTTGGDMFKLNMIVLIMSLLGEGITCGTVNQRFLPSIKSVNDIKNMDWCGYVFDCLRKSKENWRRNDTKCWYTGPLLFLVVWFVDMLRCMDKDEEKVIPAIDYWTTDKLKDWEKKMISARGFDKMGFDKMELMQKVEKHSSKKGRKTQVALKKNVAGSFDIGGSSGVSAVEKDVEAKDDTAAIEEEMKIDDGNSNENGKY